MNNESTNIIKCRKCGGPHFTIKCGKEQNVEPIKEEIKQKNQLSDTSRVNKHKYEKYYSKVTYRVKLSELPRDMSESEMIELVSKWGHIIKVRVINYDENSVAYIDFGFEDEATYFIEAIDKTPFDLILLSASRVES